MYDIIVVGGGIMGLAAAYYSSLTGAKVMLIEGGALFNDQQSSHGESRFFRVMYADENLAKLVLQADPLWMRLQDASGRILRHIQGVLFLGDPNGNVTPEGDLKLCMEVMTKLGLPFQTYEGSALLQKFPVWKNLPNPTLGVFQPNGGPIYAARTLAALAVLGWQNGVVLRERDRVINIEPGATPDKPVTIRTHAGASFSAPKVILTPGAWTNELLARLGIQLNLTIWEMTLAYYAVTSGAQDLPLWFYFGKPQPDGNQGTFYSVPPLATPGQIKMSTDFTFHQFDSPLKATGKPDPKILGFLEQFARTYLNGISPTTIPGSADTCFFVMPPDQDFILDLLPGHPNISIFTGESGQAFKFGPLVGTILSQLATKGSTTYDISRFKITRPGIIKGQPA